MTDPQNPTDTGAAPPWEALAELLFAEDFFPEENAPEKARGLIRATLGAPGSILRLLAVYFALGAADVDPIVRRIKQTVNTRSPNDVPNVSDLVTMDLREVFREPFRSLQLEVPPSPEFSEAMAKHGFNAYWKDSYWAAHWHIPSVEQSFELYQRLRPGRVPKEVEFTRDDLRTLLRWNDILPHYHDHLTRIAYRPLTRVDLRRVYQVGLLSDAELLERYQDIGYAPADAKLLADFTKRDYDPDDKQLTTSLLGQAYQDGIVDDATLKDSLDRIGVGMTARDLFIQVQQAAKAKKAKDATDALARKVETVKLSIRRQSRAGKLDAEQVLMQLADLGVSDLDAHVLLDVNTLPPLDKSADLHRSDIISAFKNGVIGEAAARANLAKEGYAPDEVDILVKTAIATRTKKQAAASSASQS